MIFGRLQHGDDRWLPWVRDIELMSICKSGGKGYHTQAVPFSPIRVLTLLRLPSPPPSPLLIHSFPILAGPAHPRVNKSSSQLELALALILSLSLSLSLFFFAFIFPEWLLCCPTPVSISAAAVSLCIPVQRPCLPLPPRVPGPSHPTARPSSVFALQPTNISPTLPPSPIRNTQETTQTPPTLRLTRLVQTSSPPLILLRTTIWRTQRWERRCSGRRTSEHASLLHPIRGIQRAFIRPHPRPKTCQCSYRTLHKINTILLKVS